MGLHPIKGNTLDASDTQSITFSDEDRHGLYKTVFNRRDVRGQFLPTPIEHDKLARILQAAHHAPSVGFMQPWNFIIIKSPEVKENIHAGFKEANEEAANMFEGKDQQTYRSLKLEGIKEAPINICITCNKEAAGPVVLGRTHIKTMDLYSSVCAVQNLWLAARAEGLGLGWVSIIKQDAIRSALGIPKDIIPVAYLCLGYVSYFHKRPELEKAGWRKRTPIEELTFFDQWQQGPSGSDQAFVSALKDARSWPGSFTE